VEFEMLQKEHAEAQERLKRSEDLISDTKTRLSSIAAALAAVCQASLVIYFSFVLNLFHQ
jgi:hypothetical protein